MIVQRYSMAALPRDLTASWSHTNGVGYVHQTVLDTALAYFYIQIPHGYSTAGRVGVHCVPANHAGIEPAVFPRVSVYGLSRDGTATLLRESDDNDLTAFGARYDIAGGHVIGNMNCNYWNGSAHEHGGRGVMVNSVVSGYLGLQLRIRGESGANSVLGLQLTSVEAAFYR